MIWSTRVLSEVPEDAELTAELVLGNADAITPWPVHEVGRNPDVFDELSGRLLKAGSSIVSDSVHLHSNGRDTKARLEIGFKFHPKGYKPTLRRSPSAQLRQRRRHRHQADGSRSAAARLHRAAGAHQDHVVRAAPARAGHAHVPRGDLGLQHPDADAAPATITTGCAATTTTDDYAPLLPKGTILHIIGYMDNSPTNKNVPDPRNWQGSGNRSVANMFIDLGMGLSLTDEQFQAEMAKRREKMKLTQQDVFIGCPLCNVAPRLTPAAHDDDRRACAAAERHSRPPGSSQVSGSGAGIR